MVVSAVAGPTTDAAVAFQEQHDERRGDEQGGADEHQLPFTRVAQRASSWRP